jgi:hypothetical protein
MSGKPPFERHLFISYAHIDNQPLSPDQQGWVTRFHASLDTVLSTRMGRRAEIWRDAKLAGNDVFSDEILAQFPRTAILVSIVSPRYVESEWCLREVREFVNEAQRSSSLVVDNKSRVIKVIKLPVDTEDSLPPVMKQVLGYTFFTIGDDQAPIELDPAYGEKLVQGYNLKVAKLAWDIAQLVKKLEADNVAAAPPVAAGAAVYLGECSYDRRDQREALETELRMHGYTVLPDAELPRDEDAYRAEVARHLQRSVLSVHLVGSLYGSVPDGPSQKSVVVVQNELAIAESRRRGLSRIIWVPKGTEPRGAEQEEFVRSLHTTAEAQFGADLIIDDIQALKTAVRDALKRLEKPEPPVRDSSAASSKLVYVVCDARDRKETVPLRRLLQRAGFDAEIPVFSGDAATVRQANQELLAQCDAAVVFYGAGDEAWKRTVENDLRKVLAYRQEKGPLVRFTYLAPPATEDKADLIEVEETDLINGLRGEPTEADIQPLIEALRSR